MKRLVRGRAGALVVYNRENVTDEELKREADQIADRRLGAIISPVENDFSSYTVLRIEDDDAETGDTRVDEADSLGSDVARSYDVAYEQLVLPVTSSVAIYVLAGMNIIVKLDAPRQERRESLTSQLRRKSLRPKE